MLVIPNPTLTHVTVITGRVCWLFTGSTQVGGVAVMLVRVHPQAAVVCLCQSQEGQLIPPGPLLGHLSQPGTVVIISAGEGDRVNSMSAGWKSWGRTSHEALAELKAVVLRCPVFQPRALKRSRMTCFLLPCSLGVFLPLKVLTISAP